MKRPILLIFLLSVPFSGCMAIGEMWSIRTIDAIQKSEYHTELYTAKPADEVSRCMVETLYSHKTAEGKRPYTGVAFRELGTLHEITLRTPQKPAAGIYDAGGEILFLIENAVHETGGTRSSMWVHQYVLTPSPKESLNTLSNILKVCVTEGTT